MGDQFAIAQHGDLVGQAHDVGQNVRDVDDGGAVAAQPVDEAEEALRLACGQRGRRLVKDDDARVEAQRLGDFGKLALAGRELLDQGVGRDVQFHCFEELLRAGAHVARG